MGEAQRVAGSWPGPLDHPVGPAPDLGGSSLRRAPRRSQQGPPGPLGSDLVGGQPFVVPVVPLEQVVGRLARDRRSRPAGRSRPPGTTGWSARGRTPSPRAGRPTPCLLAAPLEQRQRRSGRCADGFCSTRSRRAGPPRAWPDPVLGRQEFAPDQNTARLRYLQLGHRGPGSRVEGLLEVEWTAPPRRWKNRERWEATSELSQPPAEDRGVGDRPRDRPKDHAQPRR